MNWAETNREILARNNYVRKADASTSYWFDFSYSKIKYYRELTNGEFNIIIYGNKTIETDFYVIPYKELQHLLIEATFVKSEGRKRWIGNIINHHFSLTNTGAKLNISHLYSITPSLPGSSLVLNSENVNDYAIENAKREVQTRIKQSVFRQKVLENFEYRCCLTGITENGLLVASHIIPWSTKIDTRLSPHNGLCLSVLYDRLFDKGFFTFGEAYEVITTTNINALSDRTRIWLNEISGKKMAFPKIFEISKAALEYHRNNIFDGCNMVV